MTDALNPDTIRYVLRDKAQSLMKLSYKVITSIYVFIFGRPRLQFVNSIVLRLALCARGYNNSSDVISEGEVRFLKLLRKHSPQLCIDIGANKGHYSAVLLESTNARIIAFEPLPGAYQSLVSLASKYNGRLSVINKGVGDKNVDLKIYYGTEDSELASFSTTVLNIEWVGASNVHSITVPVVTLDDYFLSDKPSILNDGIDLIKIDTEGYEYNVLLGAQTLIARVKPKFIQLEYNWHHLFQHQSLYSMSLLLRAYNVYQLLPHGTGLLKIDPKQPESNIYHYSNFVFVRDDLTL